MTAARPPLDGETLEHLLRTPSRGMKQDVSRETALREHFGEEEFAYLRKLADRAARFRGQPKFGTVVVVNGIMGADLTVDDGDDQDLVWLSYGRLILGRVGQLRLAADGAAEADASLKVSATGLNEDAYARLLLWLRAHWRVEAFPYDWRKDIDTASHALAGLIKSKFADQPVNLVAHSMGGLVCRNFIRLHPGIWKAMRDAEGNGGRLIMLGTPNYGSFAITKAMTGEDTLVRLLAAVDLTHDQNEIIEILNTFVGSYQLLPAPHKLPGSLQALYQRATWDRFPLSEQHLKRAMAFHQDLETPVTIDPDRMTYIAGANQETLKDLKILGPGKFDYATTLDGDGRVPHDLGLLKGVPTYYVEESHGDLPGNEDVMTAIEDLLLRGKTSQLPDHPPAPRAVNRAYTKWRTQLEEEVLAGQLRTIAKQAQQRNATPAEIRFAERTIAQAVMGMDRHKRALRKPDGSAQMPRPETIPLAIRVILGDITRVKAPLVVVGHYKGMLPVANRAEGQLDKALNSWISQATLHGMVGSDLGELFFIPVPKGAIAADAVVLAGMGDTGKFTREDLRYLFANLTLAVSARGDKSFATVLIGTGVGNLSRDRAIRGMLDGVYDALRRIKPSERVRELRLIEVNPDSHREILQAFRRIQADAGFKLFTLSVAAAKLPRSPKRAGRAAEDGTAELPSDPMPGVRIAIEREGDIFRFSALTKEAVIPIREVAIQSRLADSTSERLTLSETREEQERFGCLLYAYLIPQDFQRHIEDSDALTVLVDNRTASFPWEMTCFKGPGQTVCFGPHLKLTRQFRTLLSSAPGIAPPVNNELRVLVIADPAPEPEFQLPGAREEGQAVVHLLRDVQQRRKGRLHLEIVERIGALQCDPVELLALILNGGFDVIHFAGHGVFDQGRQDRSGWVFGKDCVLSPREIFRARSVPRLVFANACFSSVVAKNVGLSATAMNRDLAGLAEAFFERGIANYVGAGWPVEDQQAVEFARVFYVHAVERGLELGESLAEARKCIMHRGTTWGAYQHYGQGNARLVKV